MRQLLPGLLTLAMALPIGVYDACGEESVAYVVTYIEVAPASKEHAAALLKQLAVASRNDAGSMRFEVLRRLERPHHFAVLEVWSDGKSHAAHAASLHVKQLREKLQTTLVAPYDERPHTGLVVGALQGRADAAAGMVYAVTHVDFIPPRKDEGIAALRAVVEPSRNEAGNIRFDVLQQTSRPNHLTVVEIWTDLNALEAHAVTRHVKTFRDQLGPMSGSLYDERLYRTLD